MAAFQQTVLDYLEHYQPDTFEVLKRSRGLRGHMQDLVEQLYAETDRVREALAQQNPDTPEELLLLEAEEIAIAAVLPMEPNGWEAQQ